MSPQAIARHCVELGCPEYATTKSRCAAHAKARFYRGSSTDQGYGADWRKARTAFLAICDTCICDGDCCPPDGCYAPANTVDHIIPHKGDQGLFWDRANWQPMTKTCHDRKTAREGRWG